MGVGVKVRVDVSETAVSGGDVRQPVSSTDNIHIAIHPRQRNLGMDGLYRNIKK
jgi:hypothetical protein